MMRKILIRAVPVALTLMAVAAGFALGSRWLSKSDSTVQVSPQKQLWTCGMHPQVIQDKPGACPICGMKLTPMRRESESQAEKSERKIKYWWDPMMNPPYISDKPGKSPMGMDLIPVYEDEVQTGPTVTIDPAIVQNMGIRTTKVVEGRLTTTLRAVGYLREAEPLQHDVSLKVGGWIEKLYADTEGMYVKRGDPLFEIYSPDLLVAQEELLAAARSLKRQKNEELRQEAEQLLENAKRKLQLWNLSDDEIDAIMREEKARRAVTFRSPMSGYVVEKLMVQGTAVRPAEKLLRIVDQSILWLDAQIFEYQLPYVKIGQKATARVRGLPDESFEGEIIFLHPLVDPMTRTVSARLEFANPDAELRPGMYATVELSVKIADRAISVPREAVIDTGTRQVAFISREGGHFDPRNVKMGIETSDGQVQILQGLAPGEMVVVSGQFLLDSESRLREAIQKMLEPKTAPAQQSKLVKTYLAMAQGLASDETANPDAFLEAAKDSPDLVKVARKMQNVSLEEQRRQFAKLSDLLITKLEKESGPHKLYVMHCSMYPGNWLQATEEIANPYYGSSMLRCGEIVRKLP